MKLPNPPLLPAVVAAAGLIANISLADDSMSDPSVDNEASAEPTPDQSDDREPARGFAGRKLPFGGPTSPAGEIEESAVKVTPAFRFPSIDAALEPWVQWKAEQDQDHGVQFSAHYSTLGQRLSDSLPDTDDTGSAGVLRATLRWNLVDAEGKNTGSLNVMLDHRHGFRDTTPAGGLGGNAGYAGLTGLFYNDIGFAVINLNWQQYLNDGSTGIVVGRYDPNDYQNVMGMVNPWTIFSNLASNLDVSVALPDSSWGVGVGHWLSDQWYVLGGINDANGTGADNLEFFSGGAEFYKFAHVGWSPAKDQRYFKNVHALVWHVDEREDAGIPSSHGVSFAANWTFDERWMPFARLGFSKGAAPIYNESLTVGLIRKFVFRSDLLGLSVNWGSLPDDELGSQTTIEAFWRFQFSQGFAITPSIQVLKNPAYNPFDDTVLVYGLRMRLAL